MHPRRHCARDLDRRQADIALRRVPTTRGDLVARRLGQLRGGLYATEAYRASLPDPPTLADLALVHDSDDYAHIALEQFLRSLGASTALRSNDHLVQRAAVTAGLGAGLFGAIEAERLGLVPIDVPLPASPVTTLYLVVHRALRHVPRVAVVIAAIDERIAEVTEA